MARLIEILVLEGIAAILFVIAYLIGVKGKLGLIAGYNRRSAERVRDKAGLGRMMARCCALIGVATASMPLPTWLLDDVGDGMTYAIGGYIGWIASLLAMITLQARDYVD